MHLSIMGGGRVVKHIKRYGVHWLHRYRHRGHVPLLALGVMRVNESIVKILCLD